MERSSDDRRALRHTSPPGNGQLHVERQRVDRVVPPDYHFPPLRYCTQNSFPSGSRITVWVSPCSSKTCTFVAPRPINRSTAALMRFRPSSGPTDRISETFKSRWTRFLTIFGSGTF